MKTKYWFNRYESKHKFKRYEWKEPKSVQHAFDRFKKVVCPTCGNKLRMLTQGKCRVRAKGPRWNEQSWTYRDDFPQIYKAWLVECCKYKRRKNDGRRIEKMD